MEALLVMMALPSPSDFIPISAVAFALVALALFLNLLGIYLLSQVKSYRTHQKIILMSLSASEILMSISATAYYVMVLGNKETLWSFGWFFHIFGTGTYLTYSLIMITITLDRLAMSIFSLRYQAIVTSRRVIIVLISCWIIGPSCITILYFVDRIKKQITHVIIDLTFIAISTATYSYILHNLIKRKRTFQVNQSKKSCHRSTDRKLSQQNSSSKFYFTSGLIIFSYITLVAVPNLIKEFKQLKEIKLLCREHAVLYLISLINFIVDPCIYIYLQKPVQNVLKRKLNINRNDVVPVLQ